MSDRLDCKKSVCVSSHFTFAEFSKIAQELSYKALCQLRQLVLDVPNNKELFSHSTHYKRVDKLVLYNNDDTTMQIRLHVYADQHGDKEVHKLANISDAHNHRWSFLT